MLSKIKHKSLKLRNTLILSYIIVISLTICCISIPSFYIYKNAMLDQLSNSRLDFLAQISNNLKKIQDEIVTVSNLYYYELDSIDMPCSDELSEEALINFRVQLESIDNNVKSTLSNYAFDYNVQLLCNNQLIYSSTEMDSIAADSYSKQLWYAELLASDDDFFWLSSLTISGTSPTETDYFSLIRKIQNNRNETVALLIINVDERVLYNTYQNQLNNSNTIYVIDHQGRIVSHPVKTMVGRVFYDMKKLNNLFEDKNNTHIQKLGSDYLFSRYIHPDYDWITIEEIPHANIIKPITKINTIIFMIALLVALLCILLSIVIAYSVSTPLSNVYLSMKEAQHGNFDITFSKKGFSEARGIASACEEFIKRIIDLHNNLSYKEKEKHKLELDFLQAQIKPHFLYNTLFTIKCMVDMNYNAEACTMIDSLTGIMKATLGNSGQYKTIKDSMALLEQYSFILLKRYKGLFTIYFDIDQATHNLYILHFLIQPIIENSIFHGFSSIKSGGKILVTSKLQDEQVLISVEDNGCGMDEATRSQIFLEPSSSDHIGLKNVYKRIKLHYSEDANMTINSNPDQGTTINIIIPKLTTPNVEEI